VLVFGLKHLYPWARPEEMYADPTLLAKRWYLNVGFFVQRAFLYFAVWITLAVLLNRWSSRQDQEEDPTLRGRLEVMSGPGLALLFLTASFAAMDWGMSLEPHWYSTIYGPMFVTGQALSTLAFATAAAAMLSGFEPLARLARPRQMRDLGNLLLAFVMLWAYMAFSQFLIVWCGNLTEEIPWYLLRTHGGWQWVALCLILFHYFLPFFSLLFREVKQKLSALLIISCAVLIMHGVDLSWLVSPAFGRAALGVHWLDFATFIGVGGVWLSMFVWQLKGKPLVPLHDPWLAHSLENAKGS
jgi:hypothetical protein